MHPLVARLQDAVIHGQAGLAKDITELALREGLAPQTLIDEALVGGMDQVGTMFRDGEVHIPDVFMASRAMHAALHALRRLFPPEPKPRGRVVLGTVAGDLHDIGRRLLGLLMQAKGLEVIDLGIDIPPSGFTEAVRSYRPDIVGMSALLTTTMSAMRETIVELHTQGLRGQVIVIVGGGPVTRDFAQSIGADGYAEDAPSGAEIAVALLERLRNRRATRDRMEFCEG